MRRRSFLLGLAGLTAAGVIGARRVASSRQQDAVLAVLGKRLSYLRIDEAGARRFADEIVARRIASPLRLHLLAALAPLYRRAALTGKSGWEAALLHGEERITTLFLLSSDFFRNGRREELVVHYREFYEPLKNPVACQSPFGRPMGIKDTPSAAPLPT